MSLVTDVSPYPMLLPASIVTSLTDSIECYCAYMYLQVNEVGRPDVRSPCLMKASRISSALFRTTTVIGP